jgi:hypothetical protein
MVFENRVLGRIFGPKEEEVTGGWRRLHNKEHHVRFTKYYLGDQIKEGEIDWAGSMDKRYDKCIQYFGWKT